MPFMRSSTTHFLKHYLANGYILPCACLMIFLSLSVSHVSVYAANSADAESQNSQAVENSAKAAQQAAFGELVYHYFQDDYQQVLLLSEVGFKTHGFSALSQDSTDRLRLMQGAAQLNMGLYAQSQAIFASLLSQTNSDYVQANTWYFMAKAGFDNKQSYLSERAYIAIGQGDLQEELSPEQWHELLYMTAYTRMQAGALGVVSGSIVSKNVVSKNVLSKNVVSTDWQALFKLIPNDSIFKSYLLANYATNLFNAGQYQEASNNFVTAKRALLAHQNSKGFIGKIATSVFDSVTWAVTPWRWFDDNANAEQVQRERQEAQNQAEQDALFDTINIGLGQSLLQQGDYNNAIVVLQNVSDAGVESKQALLTYGWANARENRWQQALAAWQYLQKNSVGLFALQASYGLAYAYGQQDNLGQAFYALRNTSQQIDTSLIALDDFTVSVQQADFFNQYNEQWPQSLSDLKLGFFATTLNFDAKYLLDMRSQAQSILRDISTKQQRLAQLQQMLQERTQSFQNKQQSMSLSSAQQRLNKAQDNINSLNRLLTLSDDFDAQLALSKVMANEQMRPFIERVEQASARLTRLKNDTTRKRPLRPSYEKRLNIVSGIVTWELMDTFVAQKWQHQKLLKQAQQALSQAQSQYNSLQIATKRQDAFAMQSAELQRLNEALHTQTEYAQNLYDQASSALTTNLVTLINARKSQLKQQGVNTRLAMLRIQDLQQGANQ